MKRIFTLLIVMSIFTLPIVANGAQDSSSDSASGPQMVTAWIHSGKGVERDAMKTIVDNFNSSQSDVQVVLTQLPEGSYNEQVSAAALSGDLPDLLDFDGPNVYNYAWAGHIVPLDKYISSDMKNDLLPSIISQGMYNKKMYALGTFDSGLSLWGNKAYLKAAGVRIPGGVSDRWSFAEFQDALEKLQALPEVEHAIDFKMNYGKGEWYAYGFSPILQAFGGDLIDRTDFQSSLSVINGPDSVAAMKWFQSLFDEGYADASPAGDDSFYGSKTSALSFVGHWMKEPHMKGLGDDLVLLPMPVIGKDAVTGMGSWCWGITSRSEHPEAAWVFLKYMMEAENILIMTDANGAVPARISALDQSSDYQDGGMLRIFRDQLETIAVPRPQSPAYPVITSAFQDAVQNIVNGADVQSELDKAAKAIDLDIQDNDGYPNK